MNEEKRVPIKIRHISIQNYKGIDKLELDFPIPRMPGDPDILVMGSQNGLGKTSIIECCSLLLLALTIREDRFKLQDRYSTVDVPDLLIRAGSNYAEISGDIVLDMKSVVRTIRIDRKGVVKITGDSLQGTMLENNLMNPENNADNFVKVVCGSTPNPVIENTFLFFHSYRKVQEGNPELGMMVERNSMKGRLPFGVRYERPLSEFKLIILRSLMRKADLFELERYQEPDKTIEKLNELMKLYAGGTINKLRPSPDNTIDFRVEPLKGPGSFTFDGLSSGQKEIISTQFLIWYYTKDNPLVVFIDEPELHLNSQWHRSFIKTLVDFAPQNQYIMATHSEDIMDSVSEDRRVLLLSEQEKN